MTCITELIYKCKRLDIDAECLDEAVHDVASEMASNVNNGGVMDQVSFLAQQIGLDGAERLIDQLVQKRDDNG